MFASIHENSETCWKDSILMAVNSFTLSYIMHFMHLLLCKTGRMKRISSLRNGIPAAPPPDGYECCWRSSSAHWWKIPSTPILLSSDVLALLIFSCARFHCNQVMGTAGCGSGGGIVRSLQSVCSDGIIFIIKISTVI